MSRLNPANGIVKLTTDQPERPYEEAGQIHIVLNWFEELKRLVPTP
jgi:hypothetical protein